MRAGATWESSRGRGCWALSEAQTSATQSSSSGLQVVIFFPGKQIIAMDSSLYLSFPLPFFFYYYYYSFPFYMLAAFVSMCTSTQAEFHIVTPSSHWSTQHTGAPQDDTKTMDVPSWDSEVYFEIKRQFETICSSLSNHIRTVRCASLSVIADFFNWCAIRRVTGTSTGSRLLIWMFIDVHYCMLITCERLDLGIILFVYRPIQQSRWNSNLFNQLEVKVMWKSREHWSF